MSPRLPVAGIGALAAASLMAPAAHAGMPAKVGVRVEAPSGTLLDATLTTTRTTVVKDGDAAHGCSGTSAAGALQRATGGAWTASWLDGDGYAVDSIGGVQAPADHSASWTLWIDGRPSAASLCDSELHAGDQVLEFLCTPTPDRSSCTNLPLALRVKRIRGGHVTVEAVLLNGDGTSTPVAGARVREGVEPVATGADGSAQVALRDGQSTLRATRPGDVPSARLYCRHGTYGASCGSHDRTPPALKVIGIRSGQAFALADAPRELDGIALDPSGVTVALRLTRHSGGVCAAFDAERGTFRACAHRPRRRFGIGDEAQWSYLLPKPLRPGRYVLVARATDRAGNTVKHVVRFTVGTA